MAPFLHRPRDWTLFYALYVAGLVTALLLLALAIGVVSGHRPREVAAKIVIRAYGVRALSVPVLVLLRI